MNANACIRRIACAAIYVTATLLQAAVGDVVIAPSPLTSGVRVMIAETVLLCFHDNPQQFVSNVAVDTTAANVTVTVTAEGIGACFSAGDPPTEKPMLTILPPMPAGSYSLHYVHVNRAGYVFVDRVLPLQVVQAACEYGQAFGPVSVPSTGGNVAYRVELTLGNLADCAPQFSTNAAWFRVGATVMVDHAVGPSLQHGYEVTLVADPNTGLERNAPFVLAEHAFNLYQYEAAVLPGHLTRVREYYNATWDHYFVTANRAEQDLLGQPPFEDWQPTGLSFGAWEGAQGSPGIPVCRFFNDNFAPKSTHFYGIEETCEQVIQFFPGWQLETGDAFHVMRPTDAGCPEEAPVTIFRVYNNGMGGAPNHRYVAGYEQAYDMFRFGWVSDGPGPYEIVFCVPYFPTQ